MSTHDNDKELEAMLADLPMHGPSPMLDARIAKTLETTTHHRSPWLAIAAGVLLAAAVTLAIVFNAASPKPQTHSPVADQSVNQPGQLPHDTAPIVAVSNPTKAVDLTWTRDVAEETRYTPAGQPYRAVVREAVNHKAWINTETGETRQLQVPSEELVVLKQTTF